MLSVVCVSLAWWWEICDFSMYLLKLKLSMFQDTTQGLLLVKSMIMHISWSCSSRYIIIDKDNAHPILPTGAIEGLARIGSWTLLT